MNKAQELIKWFKENGTNETGRWDIDLHWFNADDYLSDTFEYTGQHRWTTWKTAVWKFEDESYVQIRWQDGSTEYQQCSPYMSIVEVQPSIEVVTKYKAVK